MKKIFAILLVLLLTAPAMGSKWLGDYVEDDTVYFYTNTGATTGAYLAASDGTWTDLSDRAMKKNIGPVDPKAVLEKLVAVPISTWSYKADETGVLHMGAMAQDLHAAFGLGGSDKGITTIDADGISMAAYLITEEKDAKIKNLEERLTALELLLGSLLDSEGDSK